MNTPVHVVGAGLAGLSAAVVLATKGLYVVVHEAAGFAGGRCRSYDDAALGQVVDNGNHLILSGNGAVHDYLMTIGATRHFAGPPRTEYAFVDMATGQRWTLRPNAGRVPWWVLVPGRRVPGTEAGDYGVVDRLMRHSAAALPNVRGPLWDRLLRPLLVAALNTSPEGAEPALIATVLRETLAKGGRACRPRVATPTLSAAFIAPALAYLKAHGGIVRCGRRLRALRFEGGVLAGLAMDNETVAISRESAVVLALPAWTVKSLLPEIDTPDEFRSILSVHYRAIPPTGAPLITGILGGTAEWIFGFNDRISVTVSDADRLIDRDREELALLCWNDVVKALRLAPDLPPWQVVKEKRATFAATPAQELKRPPAATRWPNLFLAGDWTATGLPATIEGAVRSGQRAAQLVLARLSL
jgi:hydroxysqualene dehydroxylase